MERRCNQMRPEVRSEGSKRVIQGYASVFYREGDPGTEYELMRYGGFVVKERILSTAFDSALKQDDVRALFNHDSNLVLGRTRSGTLRLSVDSIGLRYEIDPPDTQAARDLMTSMERGDITGSSFQFDYEETSRVEQNLPDGQERMIIEVRSVRLYDVSPVTFPAYESATSGLRSAHFDREALVKEIEALRRDRNNRPRQLKLFEAERDLGFYL